MMQTSDEEDRLLAVYRQLEGKERLVLSRVAETMIRPRIRSGDFRLRLWRGRRPVLRP